MLRDEDIEMVKDSITMRDVCSRYGIKVTRSGFARCPFHSDKSPSMKVYDGRRGWNCFVCQDGGDIIAFVRKMDNLGFEPAVRHLAEMFGVPISDGNRELTAAEKQRIAKQRQQREKAEAEKQKRKARMQTLSETIKAYETFLDLAEPMSDLFCRFLNRKTALTREWEALFNQEE